MPWLINAAQLDKFRKNQRNLMIFDASLHHDGRDAKAEFLEKHIAEAQFFDIDAFSDPNNPLPHTLIQDETILTEKMRQLGIRQDCKIIFYDNSDLHTSARALWMMKVFGHNPHLLYMLDGGLKAYENHGGKMAQGQTQTSPKAYKVELQHHYLRQLSDIKANLQSKTVQILDARHPVRYAGGPETRSGLRRGHMPGSICLPYYAIFNKDGSFLPLEKIKRKLVDLNFDLNVPIITTCGSGITAPVLNFVLDLLEIPNAVYDGSWTEYGSSDLYLGEVSLEERPIETCVGD